MVNKININLLIKAFDYFIYKNVDDNYMASYTNEREDTIKLNDFYAYLQEDSITFSLEDTLEYYASTYYLDKSKYLSLVNSYKINKGLLTISHNEFVLMHLLYSHTKLRNLYIFKILSSSKLSTNAFQYYSIIGKKEQFYKIEVLKRYFQQTGDNNRLKERKLSPFEKEIKSLYKTGLLPFYVEIEAVRKVTFPPVFTGFIIKRHDYIRELFLQRKRLEFTEKIYDRLKAIYSSDIMSYYSHAINDLSNKEISDMWNLIKSIDQDEDYLSGKITLYSLVMLRIARDFKIVLPVALRIQQTYI